MHARVHGAFMCACAVCVCVCVCVFGPTSGGEGGGTESLEQNSQQKGNNLCSQLTMPPSLFAVVPLTLYVSIELELCSNL